MKKMIIFSAIIVLICLIITFAIIPILSSANKEAVNSQPTTEPVYILKSENDKIVVYDKYSGKSEVIENSAVSVLPKKDQQQLKQGIEAVGETNKKRLLEDYCS